MAKNLVIVESPAKWKTIEKFLGSDYRVEASFGHIRDLPAKNMGVDIAGGFIPAYEISPEKKKRVTELKKLAKEAEKIWIATDEDREGEAIGWHLCMALGLDPTSVDRIVFHEITKTAIEHAIETPWSRKCSTVSSNTWSYCRVRGIASSLEKSPTRTLSWTRSVSCSQDPRRTRTRNQGIRPWGIMEDHGKNRMINSDDDRTHEGRW